MTDTSDTLTADSEHLAKCVLYVNHLWHSVFFCFMQSGSSRCHELFFQFWQFSIDVPTYPLSLFCGGIFFLQLWGWDLCFLSYMCFKLLLFLRLYLFPASFSVLIAPFMSLSSHVGSFEKEGEIWALYFLYAVVFIKNDIWKHLIGKGVSQSLRLFKLSNIS